MNLKRFPMNLKRLHVYKTNYEHFHIQQINYEFHYPTKELKVSRSNQQIRTFLLPINIKKFHIQPYKSIVHRDRKYSCTLLMLRKLHLKGSLDR